MYREDRIAIRQATSIGYIYMDNGGVADLSFPDSKLRRGRVQGNGQISPTLMASESDICRITRNYYTSELRGGTTKL